nr:hypothetical protein [uncultured Psychroserpens sp.]
MISLLLDRSDGYALILMIIVFIFIFILPFCMFIIGLVQYKEHRKRSKIILIIATIYAIISIGICGAYNI